MRMNPLTFHGTKVDENTQGFIDKLFKLVDSVGVTSREKAKLVAYQLKDVAQVWFEKWRYERIVQEDPVYWGVFRTTFLDRFFPLELGDKNFVEFMNLRQRE